MAPISWRVLPLLAASASCLRLPSGDANATGPARGKRRRAGQEFVRAPNGRSYIYIAGVPGTGLDYWKGALRRCTNVQLCEPRGFPFYTGMFFGDESKVKEAWAAKDKQHPDRIVPMNLVSPDLDRQPDASFYRTFSSSLSGFEDPRLPLYHRLAQGHGDSLKVIVLTRDNAKELLAYNMKKFKLNETETDERLAAEIRTLASQVSELPAESYRCVSFEETAGIGVGLQPLVRLGSVATKTLAAQLSLKAFKGSKGCRFGAMGIAMAYECPHFSVAATKVRAALDELEALCDPQDLTVTAKSKLGAPRGPASASKIQWLVE